LLFWNCGANVGIPKWKLYWDWVKEPDECGNAFQTEEYKEEVNDKSCTAKCPSCGAILNQRDDNPVVVERV
jgi:hypothetical protein